mmetsp:Transcript_149411/g.461233  ORF Transcript_149411/g.461233 Transcript_149411/m.461233 type:complete len:435 (-) Transcript_149411:19-1323(-)
MSPPLIHDVPVLGIFTTAFADSFAGVIWSQPTPEEMKEAFDKIDFHHTGKIDKTGVAEALRSLDKAERQVQKLVDSMAEEEVDLEGFMALVVPGPLPWSYTIGPFPMLNHEKIFDTPVLGPILNTTNDTVAQPVDNSLRSYRKTIYPAQDHHMKMIFLDADADKSGRLDRAEIPFAMRKFYKTEDEIKNSLEELKNELSLYEFKKLIRGPKYTPSVVNYVPAVGPALSTNLLAAFSDDIPEEDQMEAFEYIDKDKSGKIDKTEVADLLRELGKSDMEVQRMIDNLHEEELEFEGFKDFVQTALYRPYVTEVKGIPVPNPSKIHDVPLVGNVTATAHDTVVEGVSWLVHIHKSFHALPEDELKAKFEEFDTDKDGKVSRKEIAKALRQLHFTEREICDMRDAIERDAITFPEFVHLVKTGYVEVPGFIAPASKPV